MVESGAGLLIGHLQPVTRVALELVSRALDQVDLLAVGLAGHGRAPSPRHPWTVTQREDMLRAALPDRLSKRLRVIPVRDHLYQPARWLTELQVGLGGVGLDPARTRVVSTVTEADRPGRRGPPPRIVIALASPVDGPPTSALRADYFHAGSAWREGVPEPIEAWLDAFREAPDFARLRGEQVWMDGVRESWRSAPYPPVFVTADSVVIKAGHILVIGRRQAPGAGLWALPGGFVEQDETVVEAALRELGEETGLAVPLETLRASIRSSGVFDDPERSLRGRTITHAQFIDLGDTGPLPEIHPSDDAARATWLPITGVAGLESAFAEDHVDVIRYFIPAA